MKGAKQAIAMSFMRYKEELGRGYDVVSGKQSEGVVGPVGKVTINSDTWAKTLATMNNSKCIFLIFKRCHESRKSR